ncbi:GSCOCG00011026001-RA-CDS [Cotesia congregata]|nr:GSCOCG00011026001-RA-CDS [Cotesia congregata]
MYVLRTNFRGRLITSQNYEGYGTWYQMAIALFGQRDLREGIRLLRRLARPIQIDVAFELLFRFRDLFGGMLPPEVMGAIVTFACLDAWHPASLEEFVCAPFSEELERLAMALMEAIFNGLITAA